MNYPFFERPEGFYYALALMPDWENRLVRRLDIEELSRISLDEAEQTILHFNQIGYTIREISWYYGANQRQLQNKLKTIYDRLAVRSAVPDSSSTNTRCNGTQEDRHKHKMTEARR